MPTPAEIRRGVARRQNIGKALIALGLAVGLFAAFWASLESQFFGGTSPIECGGLFDPRPDETGLCAPSLAEQAIVSGLAGAAAIAAIVAGIIVLVRNPSR